MYTIPSKLKLFAAIFMIVGAIGILAGFLSTPSIEEVTSSIEASYSSVDSSLAISASETAMTASDIEHEAHHTHTQLKNKPWSAVYTAAIYFFMIALGALTFYALQYVSQSGWSPLLFRVMEAVSSYLPIGSIIMFVLLVLSVLQVNHIFHWMSPELFDPESASYDSLIAGKQGYLNTPFFLIRAAFYLLGWNLYYYYSRKYSLAHDDADDNTWFRKNFKLAAGFLVFFIVTESMMSWDWLMGFDPHWFSTLYGWYIFAGMITTGIIAITLLTIFLKNRGYLENVNDSHIHDLAKYIFAFSIFWTYLWFSQFMLIWYSNIPEEVTYFVARINDYKLPFFGMVAVNFLVPLLLLMNSEYKRRNWLVSLTGVIVLLGQYVNVYVLVMPGTVGKSWSFGAAEIGAILFFLGLFIWVIFSALAKAPIQVKRNPFIEESKQFKY